MVIISLYFAINYLKISLLTETIDLRENVENEKKKKTQKYIIIVPTQEVLMTYLYLTIYFATYLYLEKRIKRNFY